MATPVSKDHRSQGPGSLKPAGGADADASDDGVDLGQLWGTLRENARFIIVFGVLMFAAVMTHTMMARMSFRSTGRLYLGELESKRGGGDIDISGGGAGDVGSEIEILKSQSLVTRAILDSGLNVTITKAGWKPPRFWKWLATERDMQELDVAQKEIAAVNTSLIDDSRGPKRYRVTFIDEQTYQVERDQAVVAKGRLGEPLALSDLTLTLVPGTKGSPGRGARYDVGVSPLDAMTDAVLGTLLVTAPKSVGSESAKVVSLEFTDRSPHNAATFLRKLMRDYLDERQAWKTEDASAAETFVTDQLKGLRESLDKSEQKLAEYRSNTRGVVLDNEAKVMIEQVGKYEEQRVAARLQVAALSEVKRALRLPSPPTEAFLLGEANDTVLEGLSHSLAEARSVHSDMIEQFGASSTQAQKARGQVDVQLQMIRNYVSNRLARAEENLRELNSIIGQFEQKLRTVPGAELGLAQLGRESDVYSRVYSYLLERQQQAAITKASTVSKNRILDFPQEPYREDAPKLLLRLLSAPLGLLLGAVLVLLHRMFASTLQSESEVRRVAPFVPVYASIPRRPRVKGGGKRLSDAHSIDVLARAPSAPFAEAFRTLRTNLYHWGTNNEGHVALFTSPTPGDGKTSCVLSLAGILAADMKRVLVVDADLRKPTHHDLTDQGQGPGLRGILSGQIHWIDVVSPVRLAVGTYDSIGAGRMAPAELLSSDRMSRFLNDARAHYDFILIDSPSFPLVSDALVLASVADCVLSVFRLRNTPRKLAVEHVRGLSGAAEVYGAVINDAQSAGSPYPGRTRSLKVRFDRPSDPSDPSALGGSSKKAVGLSIRFLAILSVLALIGVGTAILFHGDGESDAVRARVERLIQPSAPVSVPALPKPPSATRSPERAVEPAPAPPSATRTSVQTPAQPAMPSDERVAAAVDQNAAVSGATDAAPKLEPSVGAPMAKPPAADVVTTQKSAIAKPVTSMQQAKVGATSRLSAPQQTPGKPWTPPAKPAAKPIATKPVPAARPTGGAASGGAPAIELIAVPTPADLTVPARADVRGTVPAADAATPAVPGAASGPVQPLVVPMPQPAPSR